MMRLPHFTFHAPRTVREAAELLAAARRRDARRRRDRSAAEHEAASAGAADADRAAARRGAANDRITLSASTGDLTIGAGVTLTELVRDSRIRERYGGAVAGRLAGRDAAPAQHGHARRQSLPRHPLQLLRPELRVAEGDRLLHEEGRRRPAGSRPAARSASRSRPPTRRRRCSRSARGSRSCRRTAHARSPSRDLYQNDGIHYLTRRPDEILTAVPSAVDGRLAKRRTGSCDAAARSISRCCRWPPPRGSRADGTVEDARIVLGAVASRPIDARPRRPRSSDSG